jgi:hypothetical protein
METTEAASTPVSFLTLPSEIRTQIYSHFISFPHGPGPLPFKYAAEFETERASIIQTRRSLLTVSHDVYEDWLPLYYISTTIVARVTRDNSLPASNTNTPSVPQHNPSLYTKDFGSATFFLLLMRNIRKFSYAVSISQLNLSGTYYGRGVNLGLMDVHMALYEHRHHLESLQEVSISVSKSLFYNTSVWDHRNDTYWERLWKVWDEDNVINWAEIKEKFHSAGDISVLRDYSVIKQIISCPYLQGIRARVDEVKRLSLIFRKAGMRVDGASATQKDTVDDDVVELAG